MSLLFRNPAVLMAFYDPAFRSGQYHLFPWQNQIAKEFADKTPEKPVQIAAVCPNGAGKSSVCVAMCAAWAATVFDYCQVVATSASGAQLDAQAMRAIKRLAEQMNAYHKAELWEIQYRHLEFKPTHSIIDARKSDEEGTMEGFHPMIPGGEFIIICDEAKSISEDIYAAISKWTGYTRRIDITSAGEPSGIFYSNFTSGRWLSHRITCDECPNITEAQKREIIECYGENSPHTRSTLYSEFTAVAGSLVLTYEQVNACLKAGREGLIKEKKTPHNRAGLDLSGGGDETVMSVWNGNRQIGLESIGFRDATKIATEVARLTKKWEVPEDARWADAGGMGKAILDMLRNIHKCPWIPVYNQARPITRAALNYGNRGTEMWINFGKMVQDAEVILLPDKTQLNQLANRAMRQRLADDRLIVEPKPEAKSKGRPSPDRADATVLANCKYNPREEEEKPAEGKGKRLLTPEEVQAFLDEMAEKGQKPQGTGSVTMEQLTGMRPLQKLPMLP